MSADSDWLAEAWERLLRDLVTLAQEQQAALEALVEHEVYTKAAAE